MFMTTPSGDFHNVKRIGGVRATDKGFILFGTRDGDLLDYVNCPRTVADSWRAGTIDFLQQLENRPGMRPVSPDWATLAANADATWAKANGFVSGKPAEPTDRAGSAANLSL